MTHETLGRNCALCCAAVFAAARHDVTISAMADAEQQEQGEKPLTTADLLKFHSVKVIESHMASSYEESAIDVCLEGVHKYKQYKDIASHVKHQFDKKYPGSGKATEGVFHCVCGKNFASKSLYTSPLSLSGSNGPTV